MGARLLVEHRIFLKEIQLNTKIFTIFVYVLAIVALILGLSACDQIGQLLIPSTPQMGGLSGEISIGLVYPTTRPTCFGRYGDGKRL